MCEYAHHLTRHTDLDIDLRMLHSRSNNSRIAQSVLPFLITSNLGGTIDRVAAALRLHEAVQSGTVMKSANARTMLYHLPNHQAWKVSSYCNAHRLLRIVILSRLLSHSKQFERVALELIAYYASFLSERIGGAYKSPDLEVYATYWLDSDGELPCLALL